MKYNERKTESPRNATPCDTSSATLSSESKLVTGSPERGGASHDDGAAISEEMCRPLLAFGGA